MAGRESHIEMAERHVRQAYAHVAKQHEIIERLRAMELPTDEAVILLKELESACRSHQRDLDELYRQRSEGLRDNDGNLIT